MRIKECFLVIGSNSFSGSSFVDYILRDNPDAKVVGVSRSPENKDCFLPYKKISNGRFKFYQLDLNGQLDKIISVIEEFRPEYIVNFAAQGMVKESWNTPKEWFQTNCIALMELANCLTSKSYLKRFVQISSPEVYGACKNLKEEDAKFKPSTPYAASKVCGDLSLYPFFITKGFPLVYTRSTNIYGPYQQLYRIIPRTIFFIKKGIKISLEGGGEVVKSYIHARDVCRATLNITRFGRNGEVYHISPDGNGISIRDLVMKICQKMKVRFDDVVEVIAERLGQDAVYVIDSTKVRNEFNWRPEVSLSEGLDEVISWIDEYYQELLNVPLNYIHKA